VAKKKITIAAGAVDSAQDVLAPDPLPKVGDTVTYVWPAGGNTNTAVVTAVYATLDSRVVDLNVDTGAGLKAVQSVPWRDDAAGNTWDWPTA